MSILSLIIPYPLSRSELRDHAKFAVVPDTVPLGYTMVYYNHCLVMKATTMCVFSATSSVNGAESSAS